MTRDAATDHAEHDAVRDTAPGQVLSGDLYCPQCQQEVKDPLTCGDCQSAICRKCGTPLEQVDDLGIG